MPEMPPLPQERVARSLPFEFTDLDYFGLLYLNKYQSHQDCHQDYLQEGMGVFVHLSHHTSYSS